MVAPLVEEKIAPLLIKPLLKGEIGQKFCYNFDFGTPRTPVDNRGQLCEILK
jgi:hypothetical protein